MLNVWIKVVKKTEDHPFWGKIGSEYAYAYLIGRRDEREGGGFRVGHMELVEGNSYRFHIEEPQHPLYFTTDEGGGSGMPGRMRVHGNTGVGSGYVDLILDADFADRYGRTQIYYNCARHRYMGGKIVVSKTSKAHAGGFTRLNSDFEREAIEIEAPGLMAPLSGVGMPGGRDARGLYVVDQWGSVWRMDTETLEFASSPFFRTDVTDLKLDEGYEERGLLGFAFHPSYPDSHLVYICRVRRSERRQKESLRVEEHRLEEDGKSRGTRILFSADIESKIHLGGCIAFGPDGMLYFGTGDNTPNGKTVSRDPKKGRLFWIDPSSAEKIDPSLERYPSGLRNPRNPSWTIDGGLGFLPDVGYESVEEINVIHPGVDYGWPEMEGSLVRRGGGAPSGLLPAHEYERDVGTAIVGGCFYYGSSHPDLRGCYLFADYSGKIYALVRVKAHPRESRYGWRRELLHLFGSDVSLHGVGTDGSGEFYVMGKKEGKAVIYALGESIRAKRVRATTRLGDTMFRLMPELKVEQQKRKGGYDEGDYLTKQKEEEDRIISELARMKETIKSLEGKIDRLESGGFKGGFPQPAPAAPPFDMAALINLLKKERSSTPARQAPPPARRRMEEQEEIVRAEERPKKEFQPSEQEKGRFVEELKALAESEEGVRARLKSKPLYRDLPQMVRGMRMEYEAAMDRYRQAIAEWDAGDKSDPEPKRPESLPKSDAEWQTLWKRYVTEQKASATEMIARIPSDLAAIPAKYAVFYADELKRAKKRKQVPPPRPDFRSYWQTRYLKQKEATNIAFKETYEAWIKAKENSDLLEAASREATELARQELERSMREDVKTEEPPSLLRQSTEAIVPSGEGVPPPPPPPP